MITDRCPTHTLATRCLTTTGAMTAMRGIPLLCFATNFGSASPLQFPSYFGQPTFNTGLVTPPLPFPGRNLFPRSSEQSSSFMEDWSLSEGHGANFPTANPG